MPFYYEPFNGFILIALQFIANYLKVKTGPTMPMATIRAKTIINIFLTMKLL